MKKLAFVSRHEPTQEQEQLANSQGYTLVHVGDRDGFTVSYKEFGIGGGKFAGAVVVHAATALRLISQMPVFVWENENRAPAGEKPQFSPKALHRFTLEGDGQSQIAHNNEPTAA